MVTAEYPRRSGVLYNPQTGEWEFQTNLTFQAWWIRQAIEEILAQYGDNVRVKNKVLHKFGVTENADSGVKTTVAQFQGSVVNETFATGNTVDSIVSDDAGDTGSLYLEGHTISGDDKTFVTQYVTLDGTTPVSLTTALARCTRMQRRPNPSIAMDSVDDLVGNVYVYDSTEATGVTSGTPDVATATKCMIAAGNNQSEKCATAISSIDYWLITDVDASLARATGAGVDAIIEVEFRLPNGVWVPLGIEELLSRDTQPGFSETVRSYWIIPKNADVRMFTVTDTADTTVKGFMSGILLTIQE